MSDDLQQIKTIVQQALDKNGTLGELRAQLRAQVFIIVDQYEKSTGAPGIAKKTLNPSRQALLKDPTGQLLFGLINELFEHCNMEYTKLVYGPELGADASAYLGRSQLAQKVGLPGGSNDQPLLLTILQNFMSGGGSSGISPKGAPASAAPEAPKPAVLSPTSLPAPAPKLAPLAPLAPLQRGPLPPVSLSSTTSTASPTPAAPAPAAPAPVPKPAEPAPQQPPAAAPKPSIPAADIDDDEYEDDLEVESDIEVEGADIADDDDDEEDLASVLAPVKSTTGSPSPPPASASAAPKASPPPAPAPALQPSSSPTPAAPSHPQRSDLDLSLSDSGSALSVGRIRPNRLRAAAAAAAESGDIMAGDRSFGISHELGGGLGMSDRGGLSMSGDMEASDDIISPAAPSTQQQPAARSTGGASNASGAGAGAGAISGGLSGDGSRSFDAGSGSKPPLPPLGAPKLSPLAPLAPLGGPGKGALAPLGGAGATKEDPLLKNSSSSLGASTSPLGVKGGLAPLGGSGPSFGKRDIEKEREELRRMGLLSSDSVGEGVGATSGGGARSGDLGGSSVSAKNSLELDAIAPPPSKPSLAPLPTVSNPRPASAGPGAGSGAAPRSIYDAEFSVSASMELPPAQPAGAGAASVAKPAMKAPTHEDFEDDYVDDDDFVEEEVIEEEEDVEEEGRAGHDYDDEDDQGDEDEDGELDDDMLPGMGPSKPASALPTRLASSGGGSYGSHGKMTSAGGMSMDLRETGLSASDRSGDIDHLGSNVDMAETAEWAE